jgi:hypothetical protein
MPLIIHEFNQCRTPLATKILVIVVARVMAASTIGVVFAPLNLPQLGYAKPLYLVHNSSTPWLDIAEDGIAGHNFRE